MTVQLLNARAFVDPSGNLQVHGRSGINLTYQQLVAGVAQDIHTAGLFFEIAGFDRQALGAGGGNTTRTIVVEPAVIAQLPLRTPTPFALTDETADPHIVRWDGYITVRGYTAEPT